jgi:hypothetical protein
MLLVVILVTITAVGAPGRRLLADVVNDSVGDVGPVPMLFAAVTVKS